jgi:hypothetical protein
MSAKPDRTSTLRSGDITRKDTEYFDFDREEFTHTDANGHFVLCALPSRARVQIVAGPADAPLAEATVRLPRGAGTVRVSLVAAPVAPMDRVRHDINPVNAK